MGQVAEQAVCCHGVLGEVVGADGDEVDFTEDRFSIDGCCGGFDHDAAGCQAYFINHFLEAAGFTGG